MVQYYEILVTPRMWIKWSDCHTVRESPLVLLTYNSHVDR